MKTNKYIFIVITLFLSLMLITIGVNRFIDPYGFYDSPRFHNLNEDKPAFEKNIRMTKAFAIMNQKPETIILGSSKAEFGFDPDHEYLRFGNTYNLALPGPNLYELFRYFQHAHNIKKQKKVLLFLDFYMFNANMPNKIDFDERMLSISFDNKPQYVAGNELALLSSWDALKSSYETVRLQNSIHYEYLRNGMRERNHMKDRVKLEGGHKKLFLRKEKTFVNKLYEDFSFSNNNIDTWGIFEKFLDKCQENDIELVIIISPMHARHLNIISVTGNWENYENWKEDLIDENERISEYYNNKGFDIWDFALLNEITMEKVPSVSEPLVEMEWWWDSHFKAKFGDIIIDIIHEDLESENLYYESLGKKINKENIDMHSHSIRSSLEEWKRQFKNDYNEIVNLQKNY